MKKFQNKKLLMLGSSLGTTEMIKYAQDNGCHVIVTDYLPKEKSAGKMIADESADISTTDIDSLEIFARKKNIDGVFCGVSEINLKSVKALCDRLNLPCYYTDEQWRLCQNKKQFKQLCIENGVSVPKEFFVGENGITEPVDCIFPVIVKPTDGSSALGISVCHNNTDLKDALPKALEYSPSGSAIIEEYVVGTEFTSVYTVVDGEASLVCLRDRFPTLDHADATAQFDASVAPSKYYERYMAEINPNIIKLLRSVHAKCACVFFQGIANENKMVIFECGYRINALLDFYNIDEAIGVNYMEMMIDYALTGKMDVVAGHEGSHKRYWCIFNISCHEGKINYDDNTRDILQNSSVIHCQYLQPVGKTIIENNSLTQSVFRAHINSDTLEELKQAIEFIQSKVKVRDENGKNLLFLPFDTARLNKHYEK